jgi:hypothetical protein
VGKQKRSIVDTIGYSIFGVTAAIAVIFVGFLAVSGVAALVSHVSSPASAETQPDAEPEPTSSDTSAPSGWYQCSGKYDQYCSDEYDRAEGYNERGDPNQADIDAHYESLEEDYRMQEEYEDYLQEEYERRNR